MNEEQLREVMRAWLTANVASEDSPKEWWGYDTNVGDLLSDERIEPITRFLLQAELNWLTAQIERIDQDRVVLQDKKYHLPNAYQYLKGKNDLRDTLLLPLIERKKEVEAIIRNKEA